MIRPTYGAARPFGPNRQPCLLAADQVDACHDGNGWRRCQKSVVPMRATDNTGASNSAFSSARCKNHLSVKMKHGVELSVPTCICLHIDEPASRKSEIGFCRRQQWFHVLGHAHTHAYACSGYLLEPKHSDKIICIPSLVPRCQGKSRTSWVDKIGTLFETSLKATQCDMRSSGRP